MKFSMLPKAFSQMFKKPWTNKFPAKYTPSNTTRFLQQVQAGKAKINPPRKMHRLPTMHKGLSI